MTDLRQALLWRSRGYEWRWPQPVLIMGVLNITPDSFYDGGRYMNIELAVHRALQIMEEGADILDIGGESTRPFSNPIEEEEELKRVIPVLRELSGWYPLPISIDTSKPKVAEQALKLGASIVNDIHANREDPTMWHVVSDWGAGYICMHMKGVPKTMQVNPFYHNVLKEVYEFFENRLELLDKYGIDPERVVLDPGIGFGKSFEHNIELIAKVQFFKKLHRPILLGVWRKSFIGTLLDVPVQERLIGSIACGCWAVLEGVEILRVHDVKETKQAIKVIETLKKAKTAL